MWCRQLIWLPTLLELLGVRPLPYAQGHSLLDVITSDRAAYAEWRDFSIAQERLPTPTGRFPDERPGRFQKYIYDVLVPQASHFLRTWRGTPTNSEIY